MWERRNSRNADRQTQDGPQPLRDAVREARIFRCKAMARQVEGESAEARGRNRRKIAAPAIGASVLSGYLLPS